MRLHHPICKSFEVIHLYLKINALIESSCSARNKIQKNYHWISVDNKINKLN